MTLFSPLEDFTQRTLVHITGLWARLEYIASLRGDQEGRYEHWGLARVFGQEASQRALEQAHRNLVLQLLRMPLPKLMDDARASAEAQGVPLHIYTERLNAACNQLLPARIGGGSAKHFSSVLLALSALAIRPRTNAAATLRVS